MLKTNKLFSRKDSAVPLTCPHKWHSEMVACRAVSRAIMGVM
jgi:hypothetical protein